MSKFTTRTRFALAVSILLLLPSCSSAPMAKTVDLSRSRESQGRLLIRTGEVSISVSDPKEVLPDVEQIVRAADGFVERSTTDETSVWLTCRVPARSLDAVMDKMVSLGRVVRRSTSATDVTDQHSDLTARLETSRQLRGRMRELLDRATDVQDLLAIEKELARVQSEIEGMEAQLERLNSQVELSSLSVGLEQERILGPLGYVGYWAGWAISKLFVIR